MPDFHLQVLGVDTPEQVEKASDQTRPPRLVAGAEPRAVVTVEVFILNFYDRAPGSPRPYKLTSHPSLPASWAGFAPAALVEFLDTAASLFLKVKGGFFAISVCGSQFLDKVSAQARELKSTYHFSSPPEAGCFSATIVRIYRRATGAETPL